MLSQPGSKAGTLGRLSNVFQREEMNSSLLSGVFRVIEASPEKPWRILKVVVLVPDAGFQVVDLRWRAVGEGSPGLGRNMLVRIELRFLAPCRTEKGVVGAVFGYRFNDEIPDRNLLSKARTRWGRESCQRFFVRTVGQCVALGLVDGKKIRMESRMVDADAASGAKVTTSADMVGSRRRFVSR